MYHKKVSRSEKKGDGTCCSTSCMNLTCSDTPSCTFQQLVEHMKSFWPMLQASDVRRLRAIRKANTENQENASKEKQIRALQEELGSLEKR